MIHEPMTLATDYLLAAFAATFAFRLWRFSRAWSLAFFFTAAGAIVGGSFHGFAPNLGAHAALAVWMVTVLLIGAASCALLSGLGRPFAIAAIVKFAVYAVWVHLDSSFAVVIADYGISMLVIAVVQLFRLRSEGARWILSGIGMSIAAAAIQASGFDVHRHFNHNDLYHVVQIVALWLLYRGGRLGTLRGGAPTSSSTR